ncbi:MAG: cofactor-independent phosphoglycerate mutase [Candidatus Anammoxibacter sp.]
MIILDGMADYPLENFGGKTCVEAAKTPNIDYMSLNGQLGTVQTIPAGFSPGSDVAAMSLFGYDPKLYYTGRAPIEAASIGIDLKDDIIAFRCNLVTMVDNDLQDYSAGHITSQEADILISCLNENLETESIKFYPGNSYRHIMTYKGNDNVDAACKPPHDIMDQPIESNLPKGNGSKLIGELINKSYQILSNHYINIERVKAGKNPANMIWLWGQGTKPSLPQFHETFGAKAAVISAVDLINGLAYIMGMNVIKVPGVTGNIDTDYDAKARYAIEALNDHDLVVVHIEAPDEMGHCGDAKEKIKAIENIDEKIVGPILEALKRSVKNSLKNSRDFRILALPDHYTPIVKRTHTSEPVPFAMYGSGIEKGAGYKFSESNAVKSGLHFELGHKLINHFLKSNTG